MFWVNYLRQGLGLRLGLGFGLRLGLGFGLRLGLDFSFLGISDCDLGFEV